MQVRTRFAPSPTGQVHIGNMRVAIYDWLFARRHGGQFLLRIEDTDRERSTPEAIRAVLDAMQWLGLDFDEEPLYQSRMEAQHRAAADRLVDEGKAYRVAKGDGGEAIVFRIPWDADAVPAVRGVGPVEADLHAETPVRIASTGVAYAMVSRKGKPMEQESCLAGVADLVLSDASGGVLFRLNDELDAVTRQGRSFEIRGAAKMRFTRREVVFHDLVKGDLSKPLDGMKDLVIVRSGGVPLFHLANVCDDIHQGVTHIIRGDDHVENTFRHIFLFHALGRPLPLYAHLPMVVNAQGKPYSKRDGDAFVGDFRDHGYLGDALFNYLAVLQWSPGGEREVMDRREMAACFDLARVSSSPAQVDLRKLQWMNGVYMAALPAEQRLAATRAELAAHGLWREGESEDYLRRVLAAMGDRIKVWADIVPMAGFFFTEEYPFDEKAAARRLRTPEAPGRLESLRARFESLADFSAASLEGALAQLASERGWEAADLVHPARVAVSGLAAGPGLYEMLEVLGRDRVLARLARAARQSAAP